MITLFRHVVLPKDMQKLVPKTHLMSEQEWRAIGVQQSQGWVHYMIHYPGKQNIFDCGTSLYAYIIKCFLNIFFQNHIFSYSRERSHLLHQKIIHKRALHFIMKVSF